MRLRLLAIAVASILATLIVAGISLGTIFEHQVLKRVDRELQIRWDELAAALELDLSGRPAFIHELTDPRYLRPYSGAYWQITEGDRVVATSRSLWDTTLDTSDRSHTYNDSGAFEIVGPEGSALYVLSGPVSIGDHRFELDVALDHDEVDALRAAFERDMVLILGPIALVLVLGAWFQIRQSLKPLRKLDRALRAVHNGVQSRLNVDVPLEVEPFVTDLNRLLDRQEQLVRKARDRAGALAHGLKTPLTILAGETRRLERRGEAETAARINAQLDLIRRHVDRELARARTAGASAAAGALADAGATVARLIRLMQRLPRGDGIAWRVEASPGLMIRMDPDDLGEVVGNLLDNARKWARSAVTIRMAANERGVSVAVIDDGPGFGRSTESDPVGAAGKQRPDSSGLGLGIVREILAEYGTTLEVDDRGGRCAVSFALAAEGPSGSPVHPTAPRREDTITPLGRPLPEVA
jgi:signal transduction histidine kinase